MFAFASRIEALSALFLTEDYHYKMAFRKKSLKWTLLYAWDLEPRLAHTRHLINTC